MIFTALFYVATAVIGFVASALPDFSFADSYPTALTSIASVFAPMYSFDFIFPISHLLYVLAALMSYFTLLLTVKLTLVVMAFIRGHIEFEV